MPLATLNNAIIRKDGKLAERCECCPCRTKWSEATAIEVEIETISDYRETVGCRESFGGGGVYSYATQQMCPEKYTGTFSLTKTGRAAVATFTNPPLFQTTWNYNFGNDTSFTLKATDDWNGGPNSTWVNLSWSISLATLVSWKRFGVPQTNPYPSANDLCSDGSIVSSVPGPPNPGGFPNPPSIKYSLLTQERFFSSQTQPPTSVHLDTVNRLCLSGPQVTVATSVLFGGLSEAVTPDTLYEIWQFSLMSDVVSSGNFNACDRFSLTSGCVELLDQSPAGIYGFRKIGTFQVKAINLIF
jgi:hypothetical protein